MKSEREFSSYTPNETWQVLAMIVLYFQNTLISPFSCTVSQNDENDKYHKHAELAVACLLSTAHEFLEKSNTFALREHTILWKSIFNKSTVIIVRNIMSNF